jgi:hypothetical protein
MLPKRAIEFKIELQPGIAPVVKAPYKMSLVKMKELKVQLQGLLNKRLYSPKHITLGLFSTVCREERQGVASMCGLPTAQCRHHQEQVPTSTH